MSLPAHKIYAIHAVVFMLLSVCCLYACVVVCVLLFLGVFLFDAFVCCLILYFLKLHWVGGAV